MPNGTHDYYDSLGCPSNVDKSFYKVDHWSNLVSTWSVPRSYIDEAIQCYDQGTDGC